MRQIVKIASVLSVALWITGCEQKPEQGSQDRGPMSGKTTLAQVLAGREEYDVTDGQILYKGEDLIEQAPEERAREGLFLAFQYPVEIPGVSNVYFLKAALNAIRKHRGEAEMDAMDFLTYVREKMKLVKMDEALLNRPVNEGFSGGSALVNS